MIPPAPPETVKAVIDGYPRPVRDGVRSLRRLIYEVAATLPMIGTVQETLKWGQPSYLTPKRAGSTLRIGPHSDAAFALYAHCRTTIIASYAQAFPGWDRIDGNRAILFDTTDQIEPERLSQLVRHALTYHLKESGAGARASK